MMIIKVKITESTLMMLISWVTLFVLGVVVAKLLG
jgi:hypothetical protein